MEIAKKLPPEMRDWYFPFNWNLEKLWALDVPVVVKDLSELKWHFDIPIWSKEKGMNFDLHPRDVILHPGLYPRHDKRIDACDLSYPLDMMHTKDKCVIMDGIHRLAKYELKGITDVNVRIVPRKMIPLFVDPRLIMPRPVPVLSGEVVTLRPVNPEADAQEYYEMNLDPDMHTWTGNRILNSVEEAKAELEKYAQMKDVSTWMIVDNKSGKVMGRFFLVCEKRNYIRVIGEGNRIAKPFWRKGHNREARKLIFEYAFTELKADIYETGAWAENINSCRSIEAHGLHFEKDELRFNEKYDKEMVMRCYSMTKEEWMQIKKITNE